ncbi:MAG TPA: BTAD domain-containing putative transcriptional regulator [Pseudonocardiaceae bacterium]|nr:BTAD domain-containing putative transcriptional regulator [Pseudonocardiaceae bacterium]
MGDAMLICRLLGPVEVWLDSRPVELGYRRQRSLLAMLLVDVNRLVTVDSLISRIWGDHPPLKAADTLYTDVSKLRRTLTSIAQLRLVRRAGGYLIEADPLTIDLHRFRDLVGRVPHSRSDEEGAALLDEALELWRGEPFAGLNLPWLTSLRASLDSEQLAAVLERNDRQLRLGRHTYLLTDLAAVSAAHPLDERLAAQYMLALYRCGRRADALSHYHHARQQLSELGVDPSHELRELYEQILRDDLGPHTVAARSAPTQPTPRQLPAQAAHFIGRTAELDQLTAWCDGGQDTGGTVVISAIGGAGGIGKTWLALHWAYQHLDRFPDGQLFVDLRGFTPVGEMVTPESAVRGFLDGLGVPADRIPIGLDAQIALYRSILAGRRMLIVLDNAADAAQVTPLLPGNSTCTVLMTTRQYLPSLVTGHSAHHVQLDALTEGEARDLLRARLGADRVGAEAEAVETLLACCGGFPLALGVVVGRVLAHPEFPLSGLAAELSDSARALGAWDDGDAAASLPAVLSWSIRALSTEQTRMFGLVGMAGDPDISLAAAAALTGLAAPRTRAVLRELEHASLIQQHAPDRYRMHDLIRRCAADTAHRELTEEDREAALRRVLAFYVHTAYTADRHLHPHRPPIQLDDAPPGVHPLSLPDAPAALTWFDTEHRALLAAQQAAIEHAWHPAVWQLAWVLDTYQYRRGHRHDHLAVCQAAVDAVAHVCDPTTRILVHQRLGNTYADLERYEEGIEQLHEALASAEQYGDVLQQARTHLSIGWVMTRSGNDRRALDHANRALDFFRALGRPVWEADALNAAGWCAARLGEFDAARSHCEAALSLYRRHNELTGEAVALDSLGYIAHHSGHDEQAIRHYHHALTMFRTLGNTSDAADTLDNLGHPYVALGEHEQARDVWQQALQLYREQGRDTDAERIRQRLASG